ncbi:MAG: hypothetical protein ABS938_20265 [Psychrobacillus psychrodurans]
MNINSSKYYRFKKDDLLKEREKIIQQLTSFNLKLKVPLKDYGDYYFEIEYGSDKDAAEEELLRLIENEKILNISDSKTFLKNNLMKISISDIKVPLHVPENIKNEWNDYEPLILESIENDIIGVLEFNQAIIYEIFNKRIQDLIFTCNIADFGSMSIQEYLIFQNEKLYIIGGERTDYNILFEARQKGEIWEYPNLAEISLDKVWNWLINREDFLEGFSQSVITRALLNLIEVAHSEDNVKLFRAVMGIEALYTKSKNNLITSLLD